MFFNIDYKQSNTAMLKFQQAGIFCNVLNVYSQKTNLINRFILQKRPVLLVCFLTYLYPSGPKKTQTT